MSAVIDASRTVSLMRKTNKNLARSFLVPRLFHAGSRESDETRGIVKIAKPVEISDKVRLNSPYAEHVVR
jgi:hypothetical protein